ncbi:MAG: hypothetical protein HYS17_01520 [Micavibrio aeruginosavorus]|uniref:Lipoprotein n=1 Tax=Micavibrio aeruginosavorus TaxID=349221 RepID=A0A7T5UGP9_9BACT|nr:MAG: hypothetical protein HYS17_01520 [Micavibrio aeruginosavorus]
MRLFLFVACLSFFLLPAAAFALSCAPPSDPDAVPQNELIVRAKVVERQVEPHIPLLEKRHRMDDIVTFEVLAFYKAPVGKPKIIKARFSPFFKSWGPDLRPGQEGEYLFNRRGDGGWDYAGPGGCTYISEKAWNILRRKQIAP